jgi:nucleotide-binding universal stress UspA family protein
MINFNKVICATDFSEPSLRALDHARILAGRFESELLLVYVVDDVPTAVAPVGGAAVDGAINVTEYQEHLTEQARKRLEALAAEKSAAGPAIRWKVAEGRPSRKIVEVAEEEKADLIVLGTHGHGRFHRFLFGSVAERVVRSAPCPVLTVGPEDQD